MPKSVIVDCFLLLEVSSVTGSAFDVSAFFDVNFLVELVLLGSFLLCLVILGCNSDAFTPCPAMEIVLKQTTFCRMFISYFPWPRFKISNRQPILLKRTFTFYSFINHLLSSKK